MSISSCRAERLTCTISGDCIIIESTPGDRVTSGNTGFEDEICVKLDGSNIRKTRHETIWAFYTLDAFSRGRSSSNTSDTLLQRVAQLRMCRPKAIHHQVVLVLSYSNNTQFQVILIDFQ